MPKCLSTEHMNRNAMASTILRTFLPSLKPLTDNVMRDAIDNRTTIAVTTYACMKDWKLPSYPLLMSGNRDHDH